MRLFLRLLNEVSNRITAEHFLGVEDLIEVLFQFLSTFLDVLRALIRDAEDLLLGKGRTIWGEGVQILDVALFERVVNIAEFAVSGLEGPFLMGVEISQTDVVDDDIFDEGITACWREVPVDADLHVNLLALPARLQFELLLRDEIFLDKVKTVKFLDGEQVVQVLDNSGSTLLRSFLRSKMDSSDLLVEPKSLRLGNSGRMRWSFNLETNFSNSSWRFLNSLYRNLLILERPVCSSITYRTYTILPLDSVSWLMILGFRFIINKEYGSNILSIQEGVKMIGWCCEEGCDLNRNMIRI